MHYKYKSGYITYVVNDENKNKFLEDFKDKKIELIDDQDLNDLENENSPYFKLKDYVFTTKNKCFNKYGFSDFKDRDYNVWKIYHNENLLEKYHIKQKDEIVLFNTSNVGYEGVNINHLNRFLSEGVCLVYPWLNNIKSKYISFQHYRRTFKSAPEYIDFKKIDEGNIQYFHHHFPKDESKVHREEFGIKDFHFNTEYANIANHHFFWSMDKCGIMDDMIEWLQECYPQYLEGEKKIHKFFWVCSFITTWDIYVEIAKLLYSYIDFINTKYNLHWNEYEWYLHVWNKFIKYNQEHHPKPFLSTFCKRVEDDGSVWCELPFFGHNGWICKGYETYACNDEPQHSNIWRIYSYNIEFLVSMFIYNHKNFLDENNLLCIIDDYGNMKPVPFD